MAGRIPEGINDSFLRRFVAPRSWSESLESPVGVLDTYILISQLLKDLLHGDYKKKCLWGKVYFGHRSQKTGFHFPHTTCWRHQRLTSIYPRWPKQIRIYPYPWRIRMYGKQMLTWLGYLLMVNVTIYGIHTDPMGYWVDLFFFYALNAQKKPHWLISPTSQAPQSECWSTVLTNNLIWTSVLS